MRLAWRLEIHNVLLAGSDRLRFESQIREDVDLGQVLPGVLGRGPSWISIDSHTESRLVVGVVSGFDFGLAQWFQIVLSWRLGFLE